MKSLHLATKLSDISALGEGEPLALRKLELTGCRKIQTIDALRVCTNLRELDLSEGGEIATAEPLSGLDKLEYLQMHSSTRIVDGNLRPIADLPNLAELRMRNRRHYKPSVAEIEELIRQRV